jgi:hypothetical protein
MIDRIESSAKNLPGKMKGEVKRVLSDVEDLNIEKLGGQAKGRLEAVEGRVGDAKKSGGLRGRVEEIKDNMIRDIYPGQADRMIQERQGKPSP